MKHATLLHSKDQKYPANYITCLQTRKKFPFSKTEEVWKGVSLHGRVLRMNKHSHFSASKETVKRLLCQLQADFQSGPIKLSAVSLDGLQRANFQRANYVRVN